MTIEEFADVVCRDLIIRRYSNQNNRYLAEFERAEIKDGILLIGKYGTGNSPSAAIEDYVKSIRGKCIVFDAYNNARSEFYVPNNLTAS